MESDLNDLKLLPVKEISEGKGLGLRLENLGESI